MANAIYDGTSCIMLSGETAAGKYPVEALETMVRIAEKAEESINYIKRFNSRDNSDVAFDVTNAISHATCTTAHDLGAKAIITVTKSGVTARQLSKFRPPVPHCGLHHPGARVAPAEPFLGAWCPPWWTRWATPTPSLSGPWTPPRRPALVGSGDLVVITAGVPLGISGTTNMMKVHVVGHVLLTGDGVTGQTVSRPAVRVQAAVGHPQGASGTGTFWWCPRRTTPLWTTCGAVPASSPRRGGTNSHAAIAGLAMDKPVITGAEHATDLLKSGAVVCLGRQKRPGQRLLNRLGESLKFARKTKRSRLAGGSLFAGRETHGNRGADSRRHSPGRPGVLCAEPGL